MAEKRIADRFDECQHQIRQLVINAAKEIRKAKGLPEEKNITILFNETAPLLGVIVQTLSSRDISHLPAPHEMVDKNGKFIFPRKDCPQCGRKDGLSLKDICPSCTDSEGGKYHTMYSCEEIGPDMKPIGCGFKTEKSELFRAQRMSEENPDWRGGMKADLGIKTVTNDRLK